MSDDIARRIGATGSPPPSRPWPERRVVRRPVVRAGRPEPVAGGRLVLWRDASLVLFVIVGVALMTQLGPAWFSSATGEGSDRSGPSQAVLGATQSPATSGLPTVGPIVDPSVLDAIQATPAPVATAHPRSTSRPTPRPTAAVTPGPTASPESPPSPTPPSSASPQPTDTPAPTTTSAPTDTPPPTASPSPTISSTP